MLLLDKLLKSIQKSGFPQAKVIKSDEPDQTDDEITITKDVYVQVGTKYAIVHRNEGKGKDIIFYNWPTRTQNHRVIMDIQDALSDDWKAKLDQAHNNTAVKSTT